MQDIAIIALASVVFVLALIVAWKLTWFLLKVMFWLIALSVLAGAVWWFVHPHPQAAVQQQVGTSRPAATNPR